jgi:hypothetical protein
VCSSFDKKISIKPQILFISAVAIKNNSKVLLHSLWLSGPSFDGERSTKIYISSERVLKLRLALKINGQAFNDKK